MANQGRPRYVAGMSALAGLASSRIVSRSRGSSPRIGRPSEWMLPMAASRALTAATVRQIRRQHETVNLAHAGRCACRCC